MLVEQYY